MTQAQVLLTGFGPFRGRPVNATALATTAVAASRFDVRRVVCDVIWGEPSKAVLPELRGGVPIVCSFGEATNTFRLELLARNERAPGKKDERGETPSEPLIRRDGPAKLEPSLSTDALLSALRAKGFPVETSHDAGQFLCEEMLYTLLHEQQFGTAALDSVTFWHVPVAGADCQVLDEHGALVTRPFDEQLAAKFVNAVVDVMLADHAAARERRAAHKRPIHHH